MKSQRPRNRAILKADFPADSLPKILRSKYKLRILWALQYGSSRFTEIRKRLSLAGGNEVAPRVLSHDLKSLVTLRLIHRKAYNVVPPRVEYRLTTLGRSLLLVIAKIVEWGKRHPLYRAPCFDRRRQQVRATADE
jgi:DNA-binding HxlR family transcriptional regulator